jgi:hypothetical protein
MNVQDCLLFVKKYFFLTFLHILCHKRVGGMGARRARGGKKGTKREGKDDRARAEDKGGEGKDERARTARSHAI